MSEGDHYILLGSPTRAVKVNPSVSPGDSALLAIVKGGKTVPVKVSALVDPDDSGVLAIAKNKLTPVKFSSEFMSGIMSECYYKAQTVFSQSGNVITLYTDWTENVYYPYDYALNVRKGETHNIWSTCYYGLCYLKLCVGNHGGTWQTGTFSGSGKISVQHKDENDVYLGEGSVTEIDFSIQYVNRTNSDSFAYLYFWFRDSSPYTGTWFYKLRGAQDGISKYSRAKIEVNLTGNYKDSANAEYFFSGSPNPYAWFYPGCFVSGDSESGLTTQLSAFSETSTTWPDYTNRIIRTCELSDALELDPNKIYMMHSRTSGTGFYAHFETGDYVNSGDTSLDGVFVCELFDSSMSRIGNAHLLNWNYSYAPHSSSANPSYGNPKSSLTLKSGDSPSFRLSGKSSVKYMRFTFHIDGDDNAYNSICNASIVCPNNITFTIDEITV